MKATRKNSPSFRPIANLYETIDVRWDFTAAEFEKIQMGSLPLGMGDRFFIFMENDCLYINQWSGEGLYMLWFRPEGDHFLAYQLRISKDPAVSAIRDNREEVRTVMGILMDDFNLYESRDQRR